MPEGDTIYRSATRLRTALAGAVVERVEAPRWVGPMPAVGERIESVESVGKHLHMTFSGGLVLATHMKMDGSWHLYRRGERWRRSRSSMRVWIETADWQAVCFLAPVVNFTSSPQIAGDGSPRRVAGTEHLGPDLAQPTPDLDECVERFSLLEPSVSIAEALFDQRVCCGVGNVFKSEICWAARLDPFSPVADTGTALRRQLVEIAHGQLRANLNTGRRTTVPGGVAVYGHRGEPCRRCSTLIRYRRHGIHARSTYWCPGCQTSPPSSVETTNPIRRSTSSRGPR